MKKILFMTAWVALYLISFASCSSDNEENLQNLNSSNLIGVWESGDYFISFNKDGFYAAYLDEKFIDSGAYTINKNSVLYVNPYKVSKTNYSMSLANEELTADISYTGVNGISLNKKIIFSKSKKAVVDKSNPVISKEFVHINAPYGFCTTRFDTYNTATYSTDEFKPRIQNWFYFFFNSKIYVQKFKPETAGVSLFYEGCDTGDVFIYNVTFDSDGQIENIDIL